MSDNTSYGYLAGGSLSGGRLLTLEKLLFSTEVVTFISNSALPTSVGRAAGISQRIKNGYLSGGITRTGIYSLSTIKIHYFADTSAVLNTGDLQNARIYPAGIDGDGSKGYVVGGYGSNSGQSYPPDTIYDFTDKLIFSTDTMSSSGSADLSQNRYAPFAVSDGSAKGYVVGGNTNIFDTNHVSAVADIIVFSTDTSSANVSSNLSSARGQGASLFYGSNYGYFVSGGTTTAATTVDKINFSTDVTALQSSANLSRGLLGSAGVSGLTAGYVTGGSDLTLPPSYDNYVTFKLNYTTDVSSINLISNISVPRTFLTGLSQTQGYVYELGDGYVYVDGAAADFSILLSFDVGGNVVISGSAPVSYSIPPMTGSGDIVISGSAPSEQRYIWSVVGAGTVVIGGAATYYGPYIGSGTVLIGGSSPVNIKYNYTGSGTVVIGGSSPLTQLFEYTGGGTVVVGGSANVIADFEIIINFDVTYGITANVNVFIPVKYQIGQGVTYAYRVEGYCEELRQPQTPFTDENTACRGKYVANIYATSTANVCRELSRQKWLWHISSMKKYSKPAYKSEEDQLVAAGKLDPNIVEFIEITDFCEEVDCLDFCVDYLAEETVYLNMSGGQENSFFVGSGDVIVYGSAPVRTIMATYSYVANSFGNSIKLSGSSPATTDGMETIYYTGSGGVVISGENNISNYLGDIDIEFSGDLVTEDINPTFAETSGITLEVLPSFTTFSKCGCQNLSRRLSLLTNLNKTSEFYYFLLRNGLSFDENILAYYDTNSQRYAYTSYFKGIATNSSNNQTWSVTVDMNCANDLDNFDQNYMWTLDINFRKFTKNVEDLDSNIQIWIPSDLFCPSSRSNQIYFDLQINVVTKKCLINNSTILPNVFINDQIGLFKSVGWLDEPILSISARNLF